MILQPGFSPLAYQTEVIKLYDKFGGRVLGALDMGLGKTFISLAWLAKHPEAWPALVTTPANVKYNWEFEASRFFGTRAAICEGRSPPQPGGFEQIPPVTIVNHDILKDWISYFEQRQYKTLIADECQAFIHLKSKRTQAVRTIAERMRYIHCLSGTPICNRPLELFPVANMLWPREFPSFYEFAQRYCDPQWTPFGWSYKGASRLEELNLRLKSLGMIRLLKEDVLEGLPEKIYRIIPCDISDREEYEKAAYDFLSWLKSHKDPSQVDKASRAEKLSKQGTLLRLAAKLKLRGVVDWATRFLQDTNEKLILFGVHHKALDVFQRRIPFQSVRIDGTVPAKKRQLFVRQFQEDPETRLFIGGIESAGSGITLTAASEVAITEIPHRPGSLRQAEDRPYRIGQKKTVFVNYLVAGGTIEEKLCQISQKKWSSIRTVLDGVEFEDDFDLHDELLRTLEGTIL